MHSSVTPWSRLVAVATGAVMAAAGSLIVTSGSDVAQAAPSPVGSFVDVFDGDYFADGAQWLVDTEVTTGVDGDPTRYAPQRIVTRAQMAAFLWRMWGQPDAPSACGFTDIVQRAPPVYFAQAACWLKESAITTGVDGDPTRFGPDRAVTRAQMAAFLHRLGGQLTPPASCSFTDIADRTPPVFFAEAACWLRAEGVTTGVGGDPSLFAPGQATTRAQMAAFLYRFAGSRVDPGPNEDNPTEGFVAAGRRHSCAIFSRRDTGAPSGVHRSVRCWGWNQYGQLGDGTTVSRLVPVTVRGNLTDPVAVTVGEHHSCALESAGTVRCWGRGSHGQLGDGRTPVPGGPGQPNQPPPTQTTPLFPVRYIPVGSVNDVEATAIAAGREHTCAVLVDTSVVCWGRNQAGQLGNATVGEPAFSVRATRVKAPVGEVALTGVAAIDAGGDTTCVLTIVLRQVSCWGDAASGKLGEASAVPTGRVVPLPAFGSFIERVRVGDRHMCALAVRNVDDVLRPNPGAVQCLGVGADGRLGDGTGLDRVAPVLVRVGGDVSFTPMIDVSAGARFSCGRRAVDRALVCWGSNSANQLGGVFLAGFSNVPIVLASLPSSDGLVSGDAHACAMRDIDLLCWGDNLFGQLGDGTFGSGGSGPVSVFRRATVGT
jgi:alpha-tubulin suppressor-like RCC1 family protein